MSVRRLLIAPLAAVASVMLAPVAVELGWLGAPGGFALAVVAGLLGGYGVLVLVRPKPGTRLVVRRD